MACLSWNHSNLLYMVKYRDVGYNNPKVKSPPRYSNQKGGGRNFDFDGKDIIIIVLGQKARRKASPVTTPDVSYMFS